MIDRVGGGFKDYAPFILRQGLAIIFILQGAQMVSHMGRSPSTHQIVTMIVQLLGGLFCLIGFLTRWASFALGALMLWLIVESPGFRALYDPDHQLLFAGLMMCGALYGLGGGKWSLDEKMKKKDG
ncbi:MAG: DoxX family protein [Planctomycetes bacterium]|nr:DoxX family protein [Planctomycetota bacterium]